MLNDLLKQIWFWIILFLVVVVLFLSAIGIIPWYGILQQTGMIGPIILFIIWFIPTIWAVFIAIPKWFNNPESPWIIVVGILVVVVGLFVILGYSNIIEWWTVGVTLAVLALAPTWVFGARDMFIDCRNRLQPRSHAGTKSKKPGD